MRKQMLLSINLLMSTLLLGPITACQTYQVRPFELGYVQPYSQNCHFKNPVTKVVRTVPKAKCDLRRMLLIPIESAKTVLEDIQINCQLQQCTEIKGAGDAMLLSIDQGLQKIPW